MAKLWIGNKLHSVESEVQEYCDKLEERIKELEDASFTKINCNIESCLYNKEGLCKHTTIHLHGCSLEAGNVVACSEWKDK